MRLKDKVALITGAAQGIGREIALTFAKEGADIAGCDLNLELLKDLAKEIESLGRRALVFRVDVTEFEQVQEMVDKILDKFKKIDILINNAGITRDSLILRMSASDWDTVLDVNLKGTFNCTKSVSKGMLKQRQGKIINIASIIGIMGNAGQANYAASKAGIIGLTKATAREFAPRGILVNAIAPGFIKTEMTKGLSEEVKEKMSKNIPLSRFGTPSDVAGAALFLACEDSDYITGQVLIVDGGMVM